MTNKSLTESPFSDYITRPELAKLTGRALRTIDRWHERRIGPTRTKVGNLILYRKADVTAWLESNREVA